MADDTKNEKKSATGGNLARHVVINAQYIKDLSFENPNAPESLIGMKEPPQIDVKVDVEVSKLQEEVFEVTLQISAKANYQEKNVFLIDVAYAGVFSVNVPAEEIEPVLMIYSPSMLFPYARRIVSDTVRDGGYPPLMLDPIDFANLYIRHKEGKSNDKKEGKQAAND